MKGYGMKVSVPKRENLIVAVSGSNCRGSRVNCRGSWGKLSRVVG